MTIIDLTEPEAALTFGPKPLAPLAVTSRLRLWDGDRSIFPMDAPYYDAVAIAAFEERGKFAIVWFSLFFPDFLSTRKFGVFLICNSLSSKSESYEGRFFWDNRYIYKEFFRHGVLSPDGLSLSWVEKNQMVWDERDEHVRVRRALVEKDKWRGEHFMVIREVGFSLVSQSIHVWNWTAGARHNVTKPQKLVDLQGRRIDQLQVEHTGDGGLVFAMQFYCKFHISF